METMKASSIVTEFGLDALSAIIHQTAVEKGFWDGEINYDKLGNKLALVHSEVTEILEAIRKDKGSREIVEEISDVLIRLLDVYAAMMDAEMISESLEKLFQIFYHDKRKNSCYLRRIRSSVNG